MSRTPEIEIPIEAEVIGDGTIRLAWSGARLDHYHLMLIRTGAVAAYKSLQLCGDTRCYEINGLSRHQRYRIAVLGTKGRGSGISRWLSVTPRAGLAAIVDELGGGIEAHLAQITRLTVMPQSSRITIYWGVSPGFADAFAIEVLQRGRMLKRLRVEPEVTSISLDRGRGFRLTNGGSYEVRLQSCFSALRKAGPPPVLCSPAAQGQEREANRAHPQAGLVYPFMELGPELQVFDNDRSDGEAGDAAAASQIGCYHCGSEVCWRNYQLCCDGCGAEFIPNGHGSYLDVSRLRFGSCRCCLPKKILVQRSGSEDLVCAHSGKAHIRLPGESRVRLIEDLPFGLCQCCRPRRPLIRRGEAVRCSKSDELHHNEGNAWVLAPSQPVFDAAAIDDLLDAGLAEICASGVSRGR